MADDCPNLAASIAYYGLFSLFPLLLGLIALLGFAPGTRHLTEELTDFIVGYLPGAQGLVTANLSTVMEAREEAGAVALLGLIWSASAVFGTLRKALNVAFDVDRTRPLLKQKLLDLSLVGGVGLLFLLSTTITAVYRIVRDWQIPGLGLQPFANGPAQVILALAVPAIVTFLPFVICYKVVPHIRVAWSSAALGAGLATLLFESAKHLFLFYTQTFGRYELVYGSLGAVIGFLTWIYVSAIILLLGAELCAEHGKMMREKTQPSPVMERR